MALEISSLLVRSELDSVHELQETRIGVTLFSDCASVCVLSNGIGATGEEESVYDLLGWEHMIIPDTEHDLGFDVDPLGMSLSAWLSFYSSHYILFFSAFAGRES